MAHGDAREGKWGGNWRMEWVASTLTPPPNVVYLALLKLMRTPRLPAADWTDASTDLNGLVRFGGETKSGFCACAITFRTSYTTEKVINSWMALSLELKPGFIHWKRNQTAEHAMEAHVIFFFQNIQVAAVCWKVLVDSVMWLPKAYSRTLYGERYHGKKCKLLRHTKKWT